MSRHWTNSSQCVARGEHGRGGTVVLPSAFPATAALLRDAGFQVRSVDVTELLKAESGVTCSSLVFEA